MSTKTVKKEEPENISATTLDITAKDNVVLESVETTEVERIAPLIYLGPNLASGVLSGNTVFRGGLPSHIKELIVTQPEIADLIVPVENINETLARINRVGAAEYQAYNALKEVK